MKRKNLRVGLRVELKVALEDLGLSAGDTGVVHELEPDDYVGDFPCSVLFDSCTTPWWVELSQIRIADKVRKAKPSEPAPEPLDARQRQSQSPAHRGGGSDRGDCRGRGCGIIQPDDQAQA